MIPNLNYFAYIVYKYLANCTLNQIFIKVTKFIIDSIKLYRLKIILLIKYSLFDDRKLVKV